MCTSCTLSERGELTKAQVHEEYGIPPTSLKRHKKGYLAFMQKHGKSATPALYFNNIKKVGPDPRLTQDEEALIAAYLKALAEATGAKDKTRTLALLTRVAKAVGCKNVKASHTWFKAFLSRSQGNVLNNDGSIGGLTKRKRQNLSKQRAQALTPEKFAVMFRRVDGEIERLVKEGHMNPEVGFEAGQMANTDELHFGQGNFEEVVTGQDIERVNRFTDGERMQWHASGVMTVINKGDVIETCCGVVHQSGAASKKGEAGGKTIRGDLAEGLPTGRGAPFLRVTESGGMDEASFEALAKIFCYEMGKEEWDCTAPWDQQPAARNRGFEQRPILWLIDAHYSHTHEATMKYCRDHDVIVFFTVAGASEVDQVCDCGVMAATQSEFGAEFTLWREKFPSIPFEQVCLCGYCASVVLLSPGVSCCVLLCLVVSCCCCCCCCCHHFSLSPSHYCTVCLLTSHYVCCRLCVCGCSGIGIVSFGQHFRISGTTDVAPSNRHGRRRAGIRTQEWRLPTIRQLRS